MRGFPKSFETALGAFLFVVASVIALNAIAKRVPAVGSIMESV